MKYDNERDRLKYGYDAGQIVEGVVTLDPATGRFVLLDEDGVGYDPQVVLQSLDGQVVRFTIISMRSLENMQQMKLLADENKPS